MVYGWRELSTGTRGALERCPLTSATMLGTVSAGPRLQPLDSTRGTLK
jgi:hypothetical protein